MSLFNVIEAAFFLFIIFVMSFVFEPLSPFPTWLTYVLFALVGTALHHLLIKAKSKWNWMNKKIEGQFGAFLIFVIFLIPLFVGFMIEM